MKHTPSDPELIRSSISLKKATALSTNSLSRSREEICTDAHQDMDWLAKNIPCQHACPAGTDIPGYLEAVYHGDYARAYEINLKDNVFPAILGRVCSRPCESACRHGWEGNGEPVAICFSKRSAADFQRRSAVILPQLFEKTGKRVAVIGAGVAGLTAARELTLFGHTVVVFERHKNPGGMLNQGIPVFRLPRDLIQREIDQIRALGVEIKCGIAIGRELTVQDLLDDFDAIVMASGTPRPNNLNLFGKELEGVEHGLKFLLEVNEFGRTQIGRKVVVIGGGYTAMDCSRTALRLGAEVGVYYRRAMEDMVILPGELEGLCAEGGVIETNCSPISFVGEAGRISRVRFVRTEPGERGQDGRRLPIEIPDSEFEVDADTVILATGQFPETSWIDETLAPELVAADQWLASGRSSTTKHGKIFVAGDLALGATTLIQAIGHAKKCARKVDAWLMDSNRLQDVASIGPIFYSKARNGRTTGRTPDMNYIPLHAMPTLPANDRTATAEVEIGYPEPIAREAAARCYLCHYKFEIIDAKCVLCDECLLVKPVAGCIVEISGLLWDERGAIIGYQPIKEGRTASLYYNRLWIDQSQCIRCGACEAACPVNAITIQKVSAATIVSTRVPSPPKITLAS